MALERDQQAQILRQLVELSSLQRRYAEENRIEELVASQTLRDELFACLDLSGASSDPELKAIAAELSENDRVIVSAIQGIMDGIGAKLGQVKTGMNAVKAYGRY